MSIGKRIRERREELGMTTKELANAMGVSQAAISNYELGLNNPKTDIMPKMLEVLGVDANYIFQDMYKTEPENFTSKEINIIRKYRSLDEYGIDMIEMVLENEFTRCQEQSKDT